MTHVRPVIVVGALVLAVTACSTTAANPAAACKTAMAADYARAEASPGGTPATEPDACKGLGQAQLTKLAGQVIDAQLPAPAPTPMMTDANGTVCPSPKPGAPGFGLGVCPAAGS